ncbi:hypothetical protein HGA88_04855 [Candidatus Roizmanbacteria bacterium]|nr:hypothetical protein [Candidatus Roizmanbacteria bacterium]
MSIITSQGHVQTAEVEFAGRHPDIFSSYVAADFVKHLAEAVGNDVITQLRVDINVQSLAQMYQEGIPTPVMVNLGGQITIPGEVDVHEIAHLSVVEQLKVAGYLNHIDFSLDNIDVSSHGVTTQSPNLHQTTQSNRFADSCVCYGHYLADSVGLKGTYPSLIISKEIDRVLQEYRETKLPELRPDGKVHVSIEYQESGFVVTDIFISVAHAKVIREDWRNELKAHIIASLPQFHLEQTEFKINAGGDFNVFFLQADAGVSKAKDNVIVTGGLHQLGTDAMWGKCLYKASSSLIPYAFALSRAVSEVTGATYASVSAYAKYGQSQAQLILQDIDPAFEGKRREINKALAQVVNDRDGVREILGMPVSVETYQTFNDPLNFHESEKPWKRNNQELNEMLKKGM